MDKNRNITAIIIGSVLILIGVLALFGNFFNFLNMDDLWPLIVMGVGIAFFIAMVLGDKSRAGLAVPGSILVTIGSILLFMNATGNWEAWSYCWALIIFAVGAGVWINGYRSEQPELRKSGQETMKTGLILFVIFAIIMEFIFTMVGLHHQTNTLVWAILLAILGLFLLVSRILHLGKAEGEHVDLFWPILMIGVGVTAILYELGWIPTDNLWMMLNLWPLLLISIIIDLNILSSACSAMASRASLSTTPLSSITDNWVTKSISSDCLTLAYFNSRCPYPASRFFRFAGMRLAESLFRDTSLDCTIVAFIFFN